MNRQAHRSQGEGCLVVRPVEFDARWRFERSITNVPDHADDGSPRLGRLASTRFYAFTERVFLGPVRVAHGFVDDRAGRAFFIITLLKVPAAHQRNAHGFEVARKHGTLINLGSGVARLNRLAVDGGSSGPTC